MENTFNSSLYLAGNIVEAGSGSYTKLTIKGNSTVYVVCGLSGQPTGSTKTGYPRNAIFKSIATSNGSLILEVSGTDLTFEF